MALPSWNPYLVKKSARHRTRKSQVKITMGEAMVNSKKPEMMTLKARIRDIRRRRCAVTMSVNSASCTKRVDTKAKSDERRRRIANPTCWEPNSSPPCIRYICKNPY